MKPRTPFTLPGALLMLLLPAAAFAHQEAGQAAGFLAGLEHPVSGLDHMLAMVAVGLWGAVLGQPAIWMLPVAFPLMMAMGGLMGLLGFPLPGVEIGIAASAIVLGAMVMTERRLPLRAAVVITALFAIFHGHAHGAELPEGASALMYSLGFVMSTGLLHAVGIALGTLHGWSAGRRAVRAAGGGVALAGLFFMWKALA
ncbi:HupE/UreJ family protein [Methyloversatilis thermotolerans]|uniref:HupE/UreJ family protein n=1 Tax=Methyloversatilis thermotolerans TaxID=1346290 RepID=UPI000376EFAD|nr:HupE/UreJ family protein [Methyloversatilis thermotolerans]